jgi:hypothetical protein
MIVIILLLVREISQPVRITQLLGLPQNSEKSNIINL